MFYNSGGVVTGRAAEFTSNSGIRQEFRGSTDEQGQVRHFVGAFIAAANHGALGLAFMNSQNSNATPADQADRNVNRLAYNLAIDVIGELGRARNRLPNAIRRRFCDGP